MKKWKRLSVEGILLALCVFGYVSIGSTEEGKPIEQMISEAKTPADHEAIAAYYEKEAQAAHEKHAQHQEMGEAYAKQAKAGPRKRTGSVAHCTAIAGQFEQIAKEYEALAQMHEKMTKNRVNSSGNDSQK
jgi:hypothetical protein